MGHVEPPIKSFFEASFTERESNSTMMYLDALLCVIGFVTCVSGIYVVGFTPLLLFLLFVSTYMGAFSVYRYSREREMKSNALGVVDGRPLDP